MAEKKQRHEMLHDQSGQYFAVDNVLYHEKADHQDLIIFENVTFSRVMALDGVVQITERDEFIYHEIMTHAPLLAHSHAKHVLIIGGGGSAMLHEATRHKNVESITMVEIDTGVVSFCRQYLSNHNTGSYDDSHFKLVIDDGVNFVNRTGQASDVIISDYTDPTDPGESLFIPAFYEGCKRCLNLGGIFVVQNGACFLQQEKTIDSHRKLSHYFSDVGSYQAVISTYYGGIMTFVQATDNDTLRHLSTETIRARFLASGLECCYYNPAIHTAAFALPQYLRDALASQPSQGEDKKLKKLKLHGFNNLTKSLSLCIYDICYAKITEGHNGYIAYIDELYNANRLIEALSETCSIIGANTLNTARRDYEPQGTSVTVLASEEPVDLKPIDKTEHPGPLPETVVVHLNKSYIYVHTCPESHPEGGSCIFRADIEVSTCSVISPLEMLNYLIHQFESDIVTISYRVRGFTRDINGMRHFIDHKISSIQNLISDDMEVPYDTVDMNIYQENIFHTKMLLKELDLKRYMFHIKPGDLIDDEHQEITVALRKEMREIYYRCNIPAV